MRRMKKAALAASILVALAFVGCKPKVGGKCNIDGKEACKDKTTAFVCHDSKWEEMTCRGAKGCTTVGSESDCDQTVAKLNDVCNLADDYTCSDDKKASLECKSNKWTLDEACLGPKGCTSTAHKVDCDTSLSKEGDKCTRESNHACGLDKKSHLVCKGGKFTLVENCRGEKACREVGDKIDCDDSLANVGEPCDTADNHACAVDGKAVLKCNGSKWTADDACKGRKVCKVTGTEVGCQ